MATYTTNYNLDKYEGTDSPNLTDQYNSAMDKIDAQMMTNAQSAQTAQTAATNAMSAAQTAQTAAANAMSAARKAGTAASAAASAAEAAQSTASSAVSGLNAKAPTNHASPNTAYGIASPSKYGHTKLYNETSGMNTDGAPTVNAAHNDVLETVGGAEIISFKLDTPPSGAAPWLKRDNAGAFRFGVRYNPVIKMYSMYLFLNGRLATNSIAGAVILPAGTIPENLRPSNDRTLDLYMMFVTVSTDNTSGYLDGVGMRSIMLCADGSIKFPSDADGPGEPGKYVSSIMFQQPLFANDWGVGE